MAKIIGVSKFERLFREVAGLDVDKNDLARLNDFVRQKVYDLLLAAQATPRTTSETSSSCTTCR